MSSAALCNDVRDRVFEGVTLGERYQVFGRIGGSPFVSRYDGIDTLLVRPVDIIALTSQAASDPGLRDQFQALGRATATRSHPHIVDVYDLGTHEGQPFIVTEHLTGEPLRTIIDEEAPFHPDDAVALIQQLAPAADNEVTRSTGGAMVSVDTVVVDASGIAKHSDFLTFGARYVTAVDQWSGTMRARAALTGAVPAIAAIAYELLTAKAPDAGVRSSPPSSVNAAVTPDIDRIVLRGLDPHSRDFSSAGTFATALTAAARRARDVRPISDQPTEVIRPSQPWSPPSPPTPPAPIVAPSLDPSPVLRQPRRLVTPDDEAADTLFTEPQPTRRFPWTWLAIVVLAAMVIVLGVAQLRSGGLNWRLVRPPATRDTARNLAPTVDMGGSPMAPVDRVPSVTGMARDAAAAQLARQGLVLVEDQPIASDSVPSGSIAKQDPAAAAAIPADRTVHVNVSRGPSAIDLASLGLSGKAEAAAAQELSARGFAVQSRKETSTAVAEGQVISVEPNGLARPGTLVTLVISAGDKIQIPRDIFGMPLENAEADLARAGLSVAGTIKVGPSAIQGRLDTAQYQIVSGDVIGIQNQPGNAAFGAWIARGSAVTLVYYDASA